jgi:hypothetical protein
MKYLILVVILLSGCGDFTSNHINTAIEACKNNGGVVRLMFDVGHRFVFYLQ